MRPGHHDARRLSPATIVAILSLCGVLVSLQQSLLLPLVPAIPGLLGIPAGHASWLVTATLLSGAISTPVVGRLADMHGKRRMMLVALGSTVAGSALGALSDQLAPLVAARALQGVGISLVPVAIAAMRDLLPRRSIPMGVALISATLAIGGGVGPPLAGLMSEHLNWHAIFVVPGAIGLALLPAVRLVPESPVRAQGRFDLLGALLLSLGLTALLVALTNLPAWGWASVETSVAGAVTAGALGAWVVVELRVARPLVDLRLASRTPVMLTNITSLALGFAMFANLLVTIQVMQTPAESGFGLGMAVASTGAWMVPNALAFALAAPVAAVLIRRIGPGATLMAGSGLMVTCYLARIPVGDASLTLVVTMCTVTAAGTSLAFSSMPALITSSVPVTETGSANGFNTLLRSIGTSSASAVTAATAAASAVTFGTLTAPDRTAYSLVCAIAAGCALLGVALCLRLVTLRPVRALVEPGHQ